MGLNPFKTSPGLAISCSLNNSKNNFLVAFSLKNVIQFSRKSHFVVNPVSKNFWGCTDSPNPLKGSLMCRCGFTYKASNFIGNVGHKSMYEKLNQFETLIKQNETSF